MTAKQAIGIILFYVAALCGLPLLIARIFGHG
jgi:hypothetical protein